MAEAAIIIVYGGIAIMFFVRNRDTLFFWAFAAAGAINLFLLQVLKLL